MELCKKFDVQGQNCLYVTGIEDSCSEEEIADFFQANGDIGKVVKVPDETDQPTGRVLIEYSSDRAISKFNPDTVGKIPSPRTSNVTWHVRTVREICQGELGRELAHRYLDELRVLHLGSREGFFAALQSQLQNLKSDIEPPQESVAQPQPPSQPSLTPHVETQTHESQPESVGSAHSLSYSNSEPVSESMFNPPHIQKVVVEHIMRSESLPPSYSQSRIRTFSGRLPKPNGEVDYDAWRTQVELLLCDRSLSENLKVRRILESLLSPAVDIVKSLGTSAPIQLYLEQLEAAFGLVEDGEELFATFLSSNQNSGEKPSIYLNRLQGLLTKAMSRGGVEAKDLNKHLLRQFCRGCWDQSLIVSLQLEHRKCSPPSFSELLLLLRTEEDRRSAKLERMRKHLGSAKASSHMHSVFSMPTYDHDPDAVVPKKQDDTQKLEKEVAELRKQVLALTQKEQCGSKGTASNCSGIVNQNSAQGDCLIASAANPRPAFKSPTYPKPWFCFKCGQDGHIAVKCDNEANPALVRKKNSELKVRRENYQITQSTSQPSLN